MQIIKKLYPVAFGALLGWAYWYFVGCASGSCPLTSRWWTSTLYGAIAGATFLIPSKKTTATTSPQKDTVSH
jgi:hypothetical protein